jgi:glycosyltransferase involved in cell wall biosynthesis
MRFLVIDFEIIERGGINRIVEGLKYGLEALGSTFDYYWASKAGRVRNLSHATPTMVGKRYYRLAARQLSYRGDEARRDYRRMLRNYDVVMFMLPCPHDIKQNTGDMSWMMLYQEAANAGLPIMVIIHDNLWDTYYPWYRQVSDLVSLHMFTCYQSKYDSLARLPGHFVFLPTPLDVRKAGLYQPDKTGTICWMPQWKKWKGIYPFIKALPKIEYPVNLYNAGIEYHNARIKPDAGWKDAIGLDHVARRRGRGRSDHQYWGAQLPGAIPGIYIQHDISVDLSGSIGGRRFDGQTSCVMLEAMLYGCVSAVSTRVQEHDWSPLSSADVTWGLPPTPTDIAERLNELMANSRLRRQIAYRAVEFVREYSDARAHAVTILDHLENRDTYGHAPGLLAPEFWDNISGDPVPDMELAQPLAEYTSPHTLVTVGPEEPDIVEEEAVEEAEQVLVPATIVPEAPVIDLLQEDLTRIPGRSLLLRKIQYRNGKSRAWLAAFGDLG